MRKNKLSSVIVIDAFRKYLYINMMCFLIMTVALLTIGICNSGLGEERRCRQEARVRMAGVYEKKKCFWRLKNAVATG